MYVEYFSYAQNNATFLAELYAKECSTNLADITKTMRRISRYFLPSTSVRRFCHFSVDRLNKPKVFSNALHLAIQLPAVPFWTYAKGDALELLHGLRSFIDHVVELYCFEKTLTSGDKVRIIDRYAHCSSTQSMARVSDAEMLQFRETLFRRSKLEMLLELWLVIGNFIYSLCGDRPYSPHRTLSHFGSDSHGSSMGASAKESRQMRRPLLSEHFCCAGLFAGPVASGLVGTKDFAIFLMTGSPAAVVLRLSGIALSARDDGAKRFNLAAPSELIRKMFPTPYTSESARFEFKMETSSFDSTVAVRSPAMARQDRSSSYTIGVEKDFNTNSLPGEKISLLSVVSYGS
jgi:hypothetical protein